MLQIIYNINEAELSDEVSWLKGMGIYPATTRCMKYSNGAYSWNAVIGMIVDKSTSVIIRIKHPDAVVKPY